MSFQPYQRGPRSGYVMRSYTPNGYERALSTFPRSVWARQGMAGQMYLNAAPVVPHQSHYTENLVHSPDAWTRAIRAGAAPPIRLPSSWGPYPLSNGAPAYAPGVRISVMGSTSATEAEAEAEALDDVAFNVLMLAMVTNAHGRVVTRVAGGMTPAAALEQTLAELDGEVADGDITAEEAVLWREAMIRLYEEIGYDNLTTFAQTGDPAIAGRILTIFAEVSEEAPRPAEKRSGLSTALLLIAGAITAWALTQG